MALRTTLVCGRSSRLLLSVSGAALVFAASMCVSEPASAQFFGFYGNAGYARRAPSHSLYPRSYFDGGYQFRRRSNARSGSGTSSQKSKVNAEAHKPAPPPPAGPLTIAISIANQRVTVYDKDQPIMEGPVSTGTPSHPTPTGVFSVIQKERFHRSNIYSGAPMPWMQRITWSGVAMHQGVLPGHAASHGCIRLPEAFAVRLYHTTKMGVRVLVANNPVAPAEFAHPHLFVPAKPIPVANASPDGSTATDTKLAESLPSPVTPAERVSDALPNFNVAAPASAPSTKSVQGSENAATTAPATERTSAGTGAETQTAMPIIMTPFPAAPRPAVQDKPLRPGPISVFVSRKERKLFVRKGFQPIFEAPVTIARPDQPLGTHVFTAAELKDDGNAMRWLAVSMPSERRVVRVVQRPGKGHRNAPPTVVEAAPPLSAADALDRIDIPPETLARISELLTPGASLVISDQGLGPETGKETDFIVLTR